MAIEFSNLSRRYDATRHCVRFSGYDGAMEKSFFVEEEAIWRLDAIARQDGAALLETFDRHRERICKVASRLWKTSRRLLYIDGGRFFLTTSKIASLRLRRGTVMRHLTANTRYSTNIY
jgi:hypothetical protein